MHVNVNEAPQSLSQTLRSFPPQGLRISGAVSSFLHLTDNSEGIVHMNVLLQGHIPPLWLLRPQWSCQEEGRAAKWWTTILSIFKSSIDTYFWHCLELQSLLLSMKSVQNPAPALSQSFMLKPMHWPGLVVWGPNRLAKNTLTNASRARTHTTIPLRLQRSWHVCECATRVQTAQHTLHPIGFPSPKTSATCALNCISTQTHFLLAFKSWNLIAPHIWAPPALQTYPF